MNSVHLLDVKWLLQRQLSQVGDWHNVQNIPESGDPLYQLVSEQHHTNFDLWHEEDKARDPDASDAIIATVKRSIDRLNQKRNDEIEKIDEALLDELGQRSVRIMVDARLNSETPGSMIDRLSISALKIYHMDEETKRVDASSEHQKNCEAKLMLLQEQRRDLGKCLMEFLEDLVFGRKTLKVYRQMKMYNDSSLNPVLYQKKNSR
ncbi:MAG TPA: DUF4254 domain-containing protein [SAR324 cluster bacterium]|jgi:hypothetical protein|nr:hypothetical protein [Deltaproteobacteria bacterium]MDP6090815.1 DUF4254 domain-containing protein [SAR324 cluster bacterium]MDP6639196.1 DUF4254 domain-containing protein [SAR324 cluster bacterium]MEE1576320.1 DUF4254 domain-containing protein [Deltaproteobacteria bacterium]HJL86118.1 DUF4254 domain-containing protein [SAR324 cluster bacterium]|tara:strand:- start:16642 stop:17259 length:618 start_codon:yes stop_codon:yes gene_type:complete